MPSGPGAGGPRSRLVLLFAALLLACQPATGSAPDTDTDPRASAPLPPDLPSMPEMTVTDGAGGTLRWAIGEPAGITPATATSRDGLLVVDALFDSLTRIDPDGVPHAAAAWGWKAEPDAATWTFRLRTGAQWHDGTPVTAQHFVEGWSLAVRNDLTGFHLADVEGYEAVRSGTAPLLSGLTAVDDLTLRVRLVRPRAHFPVVVGHPSLGPVHPRSDEHGEQPVGNGPFRMAEAWVRNQFVRVVPAEGWRNQRTRPQVSEVLFRSMDRDAAYVAFQQGRVDIAEVPPGALEQAVEAYGEALRGYSGTGVLRGDVPVLYHLAFDLSQPPFDQVDVRRAVSLAVDRTALAGSILQGNVRPARGLIPPALPGAGPLACDTCRHDPEEARELFAAHGVTELTLWFNPDGGHGQVAAVLRTHLAEAGVGLRFEAVEGAELAEAVAARSAGMFRAGWAAEHLAAEDALVPLLGTGGTGNLGGYSAGEVDALLGQAAARLDRDQRIELLRAAEDVALDRDQAVVPLFTYRLGLVVSERLAAFEVDPFGRADLAAVRLSSG